MSKEKPVKLPNGWKITKETDEFIYYENSVGIGAVCSKTAYLSPVENKIKVDYFEFPNEIIDYEVKDDFFYVKTTEGIFKIANIKKDFECIDYKQN